MIAQSHGPIGGTLSATHHSGAMYAYTSAVHSQATPTPIRQLIRTNYRQGSVKSASMAHASTIFFSIEFHG